MTSKLSSHLDRFISISQSVEAGPIPSNTNVVSDKYPVNKPNRSPGMGAGTAGADFEVGFPAEELKRTVKSALTRLIGSALVPVSVKKDSNSLGGVMRDFLPPSQRWSLEELNDRWDSYLAALMKKVNPLISSAETEDLSKVYQDIYSVLDAGWEKIDNAVGDTEAAYYGTRAPGSMVTKPFMAQWLGKSEDKSEQNMGNGNGNMDRINREISDRVNQPLPAVEGPKVPTASARLNLLKKISKKLDK